LYDVRTPTSPVKLVAAESYFHQSVVGPQNPPLGCLDRNSEAGVIVGDWLYLPRWVVAQSYDLSGCIAPVDPALVFADGFESGGLEAW
jgi:hypothetical protein